jgi:hypothetical protein
MCRLRQPWRAPGFTMLALLAWTLPGQAAETAAPAALAAPPPPSPYVVKGVARVKIGRLVAFGDSYSVLNAGPRPGVIVWEKRLKPASWSIYAKSGATAREVGSNHLKAQVDRFVAGAAPQKANDLAVVYLGHNDTRLQPNDIAASLRDYGQQVGRILAHGGASGSRKLLVTLIHDWSQAPGERNAADGGATVRARVDALNQGIVDLANSRGGLLAVDLRTVFDRVTANPGRYGLTNVTTADPARADTTALYYDAHHFGNRGQDIIAQVFNHYLTRGWSWANSLAAGADAATRLRQDIDAGLVPKVAQFAAGEGGLGFSSFTLGAPMAEPLEPGPAGADGDPTRAGFAALTQEQAASSGVGLNYAFASGTMLGVVMSDYRTATTDDTALATTRSSVDASAVSLYARHRLAGIDLAALASFSDDRHEKRDHDELVDESSRASFGGRTSSFAVTASLPVRLDGGWLQPWADLSRTTQRVDGFTEANPYVSDVRYSGAEASDTLASAGLTGALDPLILGDGGWLRLTGGVSYTHGLAQDDYRVTMRETATGFVQKETVPRDPTRSAGLQLGLEAGLGERFSLQAGYRLDQPVDGGEAGHDLTARLSYRF